MKKTRVLFALALSALLVLSLAPVGRTDTNRLMLVRVSVDSAEEAAYLMGHFDESHNHSAGEVELVLWPGDRAELDSLGLDYRIVTEDLFARDMAGGLAADAPIAMPGPDREDYRRLTDYNTEMSDLAKKHPKLVKLIQLKRPSLEGRTMFGVEIAAKVKKIDDGRPIFYIDAVHHAREWPAAEYTMIWLHHLVEKFGKDKKVTSLLKKTRVIAVPIMNVDGFDYSRESIQGANGTVDGLTDITGAANGFEAYWRKNRRSLTGATVPAAQKNPDAYGVDPNRNYSYLWGDSNGGSSGSQIDQTYRGAAPFSEPENQNVRDIILGRNVTGVLTNHTFQASVLRAGGGDAPDDADLERIGAKLAKVLGYTNAPTVGYPTTGTTDDWAYAAMGAYGYTIEHGRINFHPNYGDEVGKYWKQHVKAFDELLAMSANPSYHSIIKGRVVGAKGPAKLTVTKTFKTPLSPGNPTGDAAVKETLKYTITTKKNGSFVWHLTPSSRPYEKKPESYKLSISAGGRLETMKVRVDRGRVKNLGAIRLGGTSLASDEVIVTP
jgi:hypothetical protein